MEIFDVDANVLAERILQDLTNAFKKDPLIDEFDILPINESVCNKCPVIHVDHKVALEGWCVRHVYLYAYDNFFKWRQHPYKIEPSVLLSWTSAILLINPDVETAWNARKELIQSNKHFEKDELRFSEIALSRKPKSCQVFAHRKWVLLECLKKDLLHCTIQQIVNNEFTLCMQTANKYSNNYYSWNHRMWVVEHLSRFCAKIIFEELASTYLWVSSHVSDHSGFHYRQFLLQNIICMSLGTCPLHNICSSGSNELQCNHCIEKFSNETEKSRPELYYSFLMNELSLLSDLQYSFPGHETLWNHRRFILFSIITLFYAKTSILENKFTEVPGQEDSISHKKCKFESQCFCSCKCWNLMEEENFILSCFKNAKDNMWENRLIIKHQNWLGRLMSRK